MNFDESDLHKVYVRVILCFESSYQKAFDNYNFSLVHFRYHTVSYN